MKEFYSQEATKFERVTGYEDALFPPEKQSIPRGMTLPVMKILLFNLIVLY